MNGRHVTMRGAALAALCLVLGLAAAAAARPGGGPGGGRGDGAGPGERIGRGWERLELTTEQREQLGKLREAGRAEGLALRKDLLRLRHELRGEMLKDTPDVKAVDELAARIGEAQGKLEAHRLHQRLAMRSLLTPEQRDRLLTLGAMRGPRGDDDGAPAGRGGRHGRAGRHGGANGGCGMGRGMGRGPCGGDKQGPGAGSPGDCPLRGDGI
ncbi:MAG: Spy/CpxP family protein refolding chaperone [Candidatus Krumholzibacteriia bacterium]